MMLSGTKRLVRSIAPAPLYEAASAAYRSVIPPTLQFASFLAMLERHSAAVKLSVARVATPAPADTLHELAEKYHPSKQAQNYLPIYSKFLGPIRREVRRVVEIGVQAPSSISMWEEYFPNATIFGIDIDESCKSFEGGRREMFIGDQTSEAFLSDFIRETGGSFDVVIDDGAHTPEAILTSFACLLPAMSGHGIYAIEDLAGFHPARRFLAAIQENINHWPRGFPMENWRSLSTFGDEASWLDHNIVGLHFYRHLCIIERGFNPEDNPYLLR